MLYERPYYYMISHILIGFISVWYPIVGILGIIYQLLQYFLNIRIFCIEMRIKKGNSIDHTALKIFEIVIGYSLGYIINSIFDTF